MFFQSWTFFFALTSFRNRALPTTPIRPSSSSPSVLTPTPTPSSSGSETSQQVATRHQRPLPATPGSYLSSSDLAPVAEGNEDGAALPPAPRRNPRRAQSGTFGAGRKVDPKRRAMSLTLSASPVRNPSPLSSEPQTVSLVPESDSSPPESPTSTSPRSGQRSVEDVQSFFPWVDSKNVHTSPFLNSSFFILC